jgi:hypothetical protein
MSPKATKWPCYIVCFVDVQGRWWPVAFDSWLPRVHPPPVSGQPTPSERGDPSTLLNALVAQTLDDLDEGRLDLESALHTLARVAFNAGQRQPQANTDQ